MLLQWTGKDVQAVRWVGVELAVFSYVKSSTSGATFIHCEFYQVFFLSLRISVHVEVHDHDINNPFVVAEVSSY